MSLKQARRREREVKFIGSPGAEEILADSEMWLDRDSKSSALALSAAFSFSTDLRLD